MIAVSWPRLAEWQEELEAVHRRVAAERELHAPLYEFLVRSADEILGLPSHTDYLRPERVARCVVRWAYGFPLGGDHGGLGIPGLAGGTALAAGALRRRQSRLASLTCAELVVTTMTLWPTQDHERTRAHVDSRLEEAEIPHPWEVYGHGARLISAWLEDGSAQPSEQDFAAWLREHAEA